MLSISPQDWTEVSWRLEQHHALFYQLWQLGKPVLDSSYPTAAIRFNEDGQVLEFIFNPIFWASLDNETRAFAVAHESLHVLLNHGSRMSTAIKEQDSKALLACNQSLDVVVNHLLVDSFGFQKDQILNSEILCWVDTVFPNQSLPTGQSFEYYYTHYQNSEAKTLDDHASLSHPKISELLERALGRLSPEERNSLDSVCGKAKGATSASIQVKPIIKRKWESVLKTKLKKSDLLLAEQWARLPRRLNLLDSSLLLPSDLETDQFKPEIFQVWIFLDSSGSCWGIKNRLYQAAKSLDPRRFKVKLHTFDTQVYAVEEGQVIGSGGTNFSCIEYYLQQKETYPDAVFVLTDGIGSSVQPQFPERWHWFLTLPASSLPSSSTKHWLSDFE